MYAVFENDGLDEAKECAAELRAFHREEGRRPNANFHKMTKAEEAEWCR